jgi:hypothetical protein
MGRFVPDVDIDFADRDAALQGIQHISASRIERDDLRKHNVGIYLHSIPTDPLTGWSSITYDEAEARGYFKLDFLNLNVYKDIKDEDHLNRLLAMPPMWEILENREVCDQLFQLGGLIDGIPTYELLDAYKPRSIMDLAIFLSLIRPRKKHLIGREWEEICQDIWTPGDEDLYGFKKAHAISYAHVIVVQMNLWLENALAAQSSPVDEPIEFDDA